ncbi:MAG: glycosyltransferase [Pirellula sp.]
MRILFWHPTYVLGGGYSLLVNLLDQLGQHSGVTQVTAALHRDYEKWIKPDQFSAKIKLVQVDSGQPIESVFRDEDVVYMFWPHGVAFPQVPVPTVCLYHDTILLDAYGVHTTDSFLTSMESAISQTVANYSRVIVTSHYTKRRFSEIVGNELAKKVLVLPHIADSQSSGVNSFPSKELGKSFDPVDGRPYLLYPANVSEHKNHLALMIALSKRRRKDVPLVLCGYGTEGIGKMDRSPNAYINRLNKTIVDRGLRSGADFRALGYVEDWQSEALMSHAMGLIMPTRAEGMGLPIHEAIEKGLPVIASDLPVLREHFQRRSEAILWVDPECPSDIAAAWDTLCDRYDELRSKALQNRGSGVTWQDLCHRTFSILDQEVRNAPASIRIHSSLPVQYKPRKRWLKNVERSIKKLWRRTG